ncbi:peptidase [Thermoanaerobacterium sp. DL9XJH110]|uniref:peptidase n=1 Tax=Thermoanaerobacterium sp. DL9XJH110 TaxID=3386643 RepID=UPI003BB57BAB
MKRKFHKTLVLFSIVCILILGISSVVFAAYATSDKKETTVYGYTYMYSAGVYTNGTYVSAETAVSCIDQNVPTGYMGAKARLYDSDANLILESSWEYNDEELAGFNTWTKTYTTSGNYYSFGQVRLYNGDGYNTYSTYKSPIVTLGSSKSSLLKPRDISNYRYQVNEYGETYGSNAYADILGEEPDLVAAIGIDGTHGYVRSSDLDSPSPRTPEEAIAQNNLGDKLIPLYDKDGRTVIGQFKIVSGRVGQVEYFTDDKN